LLKNKYIKMEIQRTHHINEHEVREREKKKDRGSQFRLNDNKIRWVKLFFLCFIIGRSACAHF